MHYTKIKCYALIPTIYFRREQGTHIAFHFLGWHFYKCLHASEIEDNHRHQPGV